MPTLILAKLINYDFLYVLCSVRLEFLKLKCELSIIINVLPNNKIRNFTLYSLHIKPRERIFYL